MRALSALQEVSEGDVSERDNRRSAGGETDRDRLIRNEERIQYLEDQVKELVVSKNTWATLTALMTAAGMAAGWLVTQLAGLFHGNGK